MGGWEPEIKSRSLSQVTGIRPWFYDLCLTDIPLYGPVSEGDPSDPGQLARGKERGWLKNVAEGNEFAEKELRCIG
jgi:hypothetical protein